MPTSLPEAAVLSASQVAEYHEQGYVVAEGLYRRAEVLTWKEWLAAQRRAQPQLFKTGCRVWMVEDLQEPLRGWVSDAAVTGALGQLLGPMVEFLSVKLVLKEHRLNHATALHQDASYWGGSAKISVWIALDDATPDNGCLKMVPGSHRSVLNHGQVGSVGYEAHPEGQSDRSFPNRLEPQAYERCVREAVAVPVRRGDAVFFHDLTVHGSFANRSGEDRWSLVSTYRSGREADEAVVWKQAMRV